MSRHLSVAKVVLDNPLPHLDRLFDYQIPEELDETCVPGVKVKVKFSGRNMEAWVVERVELTSHHKKLSDITKVISNYPVLMPEVLQLCQIVADRFVGNLTDVLRFAIPPRQAKIEKSHIAENFSPKIDMINNQTKQQSITFPPKYDHVSDLVQLILNAKKSQKQ